MSEQKSYLLKLCGEYLDFETRWLILDDTYNVCVRLLSRYHKGRATQADGRQAIAELSTKCQYVLDAVKREIEHHHGLIKPDHRLELLDAWAKYLDQLHNLFSLALKAGKLDVASFKRLEIERQRLFHREAILLSIGTDKIEAVNAKLDRARRKRGGGGSHTQKPVETSEDARQAHQLYTCQGITQTEVAKTMSKIKRKPFTQGQVSKLIDKHIKFLEANGLPVAKRPKIKKTTIDPSRTDMGARTDGRKRPDPRNLND